MYTTSDRQNCTLATFKNGSCNSKLCRMKATAAATLYN